MYLLGFDIGSSSVKVALLDAHTNKYIATAFSPKQEMEMVSTQSGWAEQSPEVWWKHLVEATKEVLTNSNCKKEDIKAIGISYQMHGLVLVDREYKVLRPSIIWCDSRAVTIGEEAFDSIGHTKCLSHLLNSPGNFTASKLKWVKENELNVYAKIYKMMLPGDYIAMKLTGEITTTNTGLSEGILWDFKTNTTADFLLDHYGISKELLPKVVPVFSNQGKLTKEAAGAMGLSEHTIVAYRAGDQPNNALSLQVLNPGEVAATAGTSGVIYGVANEVQYDTYSRVNTFAHVNHTNETTRLGVLLCVNGTGIFNNWIKNKLLLGDKQLTYAHMNELAAQAPIGADNMYALPFGNGAERVLSNKNLGAQWVGFNFNKHELSHVIRSSQEGIVYSLYYGLEIMQKLGVNPTTIRAGEANMFLSPVFREAFACTTGAAIELYNTDGAQGAARAAGYGAGVYSDLKETFSGLKAIQVIEPDKEKTEAYKLSYQKWKEILEKQLI